MSDKLGINDLKEAVALGLSVGELASKLSDGIGVDDAAALMEVVTRLPSGIGGLSNVVPEFKDLDDAEKQELKKFVEDDFDLENDTIETAIEWGLKIAIDLSSIIGVFKK